MQNHAALIETALAEAMSAGWQRRTTVFLFCLLAYIEKELPRFLLEALDLQ